LKYINFVYQNNPVCLTVMLSRHISFEDSMNSIYSLI